MSKLAQTRLQAIRAVIAVAGGDSSQVAAIRTAGQRATLLSARVERLQLRTTMDYQARSISESPWALAARRWLPGQPRTCIEEPAVLAGAAIAPTDSRSDGPVRFDTIGCHAQQLFLSGDYAGLDALIRGGEARLSDLPDGSSTLSAVYAGLDNLFTYSRLTVQEVLSHTAVWRRTVRGSAEPDLVEAILFRDWAWSARGHGGAPDVTPQAWALFAYRSEMAAAALEDAKPLSRINPDWYVQSLNVGLDQSSRADQLRVVFNEGVQRFSTYNRLYSAMLRILMPRWLGSYENIDGFIRDVSGALPSPLTHDWSFDNPAGDPALYARLYWTYASLERDEINIFSDAQARWDMMRPGFNMLRQRYPTSDFVLNGFAKMACVAGDHDTYGQLRPRLTGHVSASAWSEKLTLASCDAKMTRAPGTAATSPSPH
jgi:hypothetical protein